LSVGLTVLGVGVVTGQNYPYEPIRIVTAEVGGGSGYAPLIVAHGPYDATLDIVAERAKKATSD